MAGSKKKDFIRRHFLRKNGAGFTLIEVILAIFILTVGVGGSYALIQQTLTSASIFQSRITAAYLVQEGIEIVKNIRDSNWLAQRMDPSISWDQYLLAGDWQIDYKNRILPHGDRGHFLNIDANGFYSYALGQPTPFKRKITIIKEDEHPERIEVIVEVSWQERGRDRYFRAGQYLYNWYKP